MDKIGFLGLGTMGGPMARNILKKGYAVRAFDLNPAAIERHVAAGGTAAATTADIAEGSDIVITMLPDGPDVERAVLGEDGLVHVMKPGSVLVDMSTIDPAVTRRVGAALAEMGIGLVDSPVGKTADDAVAGTLPVLTRRSTLLLASPGPPALAVCHCGKKPLSR